MRGRDEGARVRVDGVPPVLRALPPPHPADGNPVLGHSDGGAEESKKLLGEGAEVRLRGVGGGGLPPPPRVEATLTVSAVPPHHESDAEKEADENVGEGWFPLIARRRRRRAGRVR